MLRTIVLLTLVAGAALLGPGSAAEPVSPPVLRILVFTKTAGFRHASIPVAIQAVADLGAKNGFGVDATEDAAAFSDANLANYGAVVFLLTTGDVLDDGQQAAFQRYIRAGGGFVGVHSAADTEHDWPWYGGLVGAYFLSHPEIQTAAIDVADPRDASTAALPARWSRTDEWYNFAANPRPSVHVLATIDETSYNPGEGAMGADHPIAWWHDYDGGRAWYTAGGTYGCLVLRAAVPRPSARRDHVRRRPRQEPRSDHHAGRARPAEDPLADDLPARPSHRRHRPGIRLPALLGEAAGRPAGPLPDVSAPLRRHVGARDDRRAAARSPAAHGGGHRSGDGPEHHGTSLGPHPLRRGTRFRTTAFG